MSNIQQIVMNRIKVTLVEKQKTNRWGNQRILYQDGALINRNPLLLNCKKSRIYWRLIFILYCDLKKYKCESD